MPQILVVADSPGEEGAVVYRERISSSDLESAHFSGQLVERVGWAVQDANLFERQAGARPAAAPTPSPARRPSSG